jgi:predicted membrane-bound spermidine synthase
LGNPLAPEESAATTFWKLTCIYGAAALPFFFAGGALTLAVRKFAQDISRLYCFDLFGAACGCLLLVPVMNRMGAVQTVLLVSFLAAAAALLLASAGAASRRDLVGLMLLAAGFAALVIDNGLHQRLRVRQAKGQDERGVIFSRWNSFSRITVVGSLRRSGVLVQIDADAATPLTRAGSIFRTLDYQRHQVEALVYHLRPHAKTLILGAGAGNDVVIARLFGARAITAVEINPIIPYELMTVEPFRSYAGPIYQQPGVRLVVDEGRSFLRSSSERYEVIQATMVDTWAATAAGAFALAENYLYTVEAFQDYLTHLEDGGILSITRWYFEPPDQLLRLVGIARTALGELGIADPARHMLLVCSKIDPGTRRAPATFLLKKSGFSDVELLAVEQVAARNNFDILYSPLSRPANDFSRLIEASDPAPVWRSLEGEVEPTWDNSPFFFNTVRIRNLPKLLGSSGEWYKTNLGTLVLLLLLGLTALLTLVFIVGPLLLVRRRLRHRSTAATVRTLLLFACLGVGFILIEIAMIQKCILFLGYPVYSLTVVLFSLLSFSGLGSLMSGRFREANLSATLNKLLALVAVVVLLYVVALTPLFYPLAHWTRPYRIALTVITLAPLGLVMGMPMPTAIRIAARTAPDLVPWGWGINGAASVLGSIAALVIAILTGFNQVFLVGAGFYLLAVLFGPPLQRS